MPLSVVIPVYNSAACLPELARQLTATLDGLAQPCEIILVDDASPDDSWTVIEGLVREYPWLAAVRLMRNYGQQQATLFGLSLARGDVVVTMDDDLQQPPDQIPLLLEALAAHPEMDAVIGCYREKQHRWYRNWGSALIRALNRR
ncbi:MAG: glycosyltransferase, partial [Verrucomicrobia bacterium]|nr:glycosyltransferase [Verrucomicrobiota bacterium]